MTKRAIECELRRLVKAWKRVLRLPHWEITVKIVPRREDELARVVPDNVGRTAEIEMGEFRKEPYDVEQTLVHEMIHLVLDDVCECVEGAGSKAVEQDMEQAVDSLATSFVGQERYSEMFDAN